MTEAVKYLRAGQTVHLDLIPVYHPLYSWVVIKQPSMPGVSAAY